MQRPRYGAAVRIERGFVRLDHGDMHYRMGGVGPVVVALHESPRSSLSMLPLIEALAQSHRVIAPDTPGYGLSDPLIDEDPTLADFVAALGEFLDSLGLQKVALYGAHTGAAVAVKFALAHPDRVTSLVLDGLSAFTPLEVEAFRTRYLQPYAPDWGGAHVMQLWSRVKDLFTWFPWYEQDLISRLGHEPPSLEALHLSALGFLQSARHYGKAYIRAAAFQPNLELKKLSMPTTVMVRPDDLIADHLGRLEQGPGWQMVRLKPGHAAWAEALLSAIVRGRAPDHRIAQSASREGSRLVPVGQGWTHVIFSGPQSGTVRLVLPDLPGDLKDLVAEQAARFPEARLVAFSPPGCGWSDPLEGRVSLEDVIETLDQALRHLGLQPEAITADGAGAVLARLWVNRRRWRCPIELWRPPVWLDSPERLPERSLLEPGSCRWDGTHLTGAWFQIRDLALYQVPPGTGSPVRRYGRENLDVEVLDRRFRSYVEGPECAELLNLSVAEVSAAGRSLLIRQTP